MRYMFTLENTAEVHAIMLENMDEVRKELTELIEQAACSINMLGPTDFSEMDGLQKTLDEIKQSIDEISETPSELVEEAKDATDSAHETLQKVLGKEVEDATESIDAVSKAIQSLQDLCGQIAELEDEQSPDEEQTADEEQVAEVQAESQDGVCIPEDDVALVLDFIAESNEHL